MSEYLRHCGEKISDTKELREHLEKLLLNQQVEKIEDTRLTLKNGTVLLLIDDYDCCAKAAGQFKALGDDFQGAITSVEVSREIDEQYGDMEVNIKLLHNGDGVIDLTGGADSGSSGWYFTVLSLQVVKVNGEYVGTYHLAWSRGHEE